jgi:hypothetical protein
MLHFESQIFESYNRREFNGRRKLSQSTLCERNAFARMPAWAIRELESHQRDWQHEVLRF